MFEDFSKRSKAGKAALDLAKERNWSDIALTDIAREADLSLAELRREFACKTDILRAFQAELDEAVLAKTRAGGEPSTPRDRLFDIVMSRFEIMQPYKPALKRIASHLRCRPGEAAVLAGSSLQSQYWMLEAAGAKLDGPGGALRVGGLAAIYGKVFCVWLDDDTATPDKTIAALGKRLGQGQRLLAGIESTCADLCRFACGLMPRGWKHEKTKQETGPGAGPAPAPSA